MNETAIAAREALWISLQVGGPLLLLLLAVGLVIAVLQALTQVNEATLAFLPKVVVLYSYQDQDVAMLCPGGLVRRGCCCPAWVNRKCRARSVSASAWRWSCC